MTPIRKLPITHYLLLALQGELSSAQERDHLGGNADTLVVKAKILLPKREQ